MGDSVGSASGNTANNDNAALHEQMRVMMEQIMHLQNTIDRRNNRSGSNSPRRNPTPQPAPTTDNAPKLQFKPEEIGFFDPELSNEHGEQDMVPIGKETWIRSVYAFKQRIKDVAAVKGEEIVRTNLSLCLRGAALAWYTNELGDEAKVGMRHELNSWYTALTKRFRENPAVASRKLMGVKYTDRDVRNGKSPGLYVGEALRHADGADIPEYNALLIAWQGLDVELQRDIPQPTQTTKKEDFIRQMEDRRYTWEIACEQRAYPQSRNTYKQTPKQRNEPKPQYNSRQGYGNQAYYPQQPMHVPYPQPYPVPVYPPQSGWPPEGYNSYWENKAQQQAQNPQNPIQTAQKDQPPLQAPKQPLMITAGAAGITQSRQYGPGYGANNRGSNRGRSPGGFRPHQRSNYNYQQQQQRNILAYHGTDESHEQEDDQLQETDESEDPEQPDFRGEESFAGYVETSSPEKKTCLHCGKVFPSGNLMHKHLKTEACITKMMPLSNESEPPATQKVPKATSREYASALDDCKSLIGCKIHKGSARESVGDGQIFRKYHYATCRASLKLDSTLEIVCLDTGCTMTIADRDWIKKLRPDLKIYHMQEPINVRGIGTTKYPTDEYVKLDFYIPGLVNGRIEAIEIIAEVHLVRNLKAKMLVGVDILDPEGLDISFSNRTLTTCRVEGWGTDIHARAKDNVRVRRNVRTLKQLTIAPHTAMAVPIEFGHDGLPEDRDLIFKPQYPGACAHLVDANFHVVHVRNDTDRPMKLNRRNRVGKIVEMEEEWCYYVDDDSHGLAALNPLKSSSDYVRPPTDSEDVTVSYGIKVHKDAQPDILNRIIKKHPNLWTETGRVVDVPEEHWMQIRLKDNWEATGAKLSHKPYPVPQNERVIIDETLDKLHEQGKAEWTQGPVPYAFPVFVAWRIVYKDGKAIRKGRAVIDIRGLNRATVSDAYPLPLQSDIISSILGCKYISVMDGTDFFYQWRVAKKDCEKFTIISHRGLETPKVAIMGYKGSPPYVQRMMDSILRPYKSFARCYIDDIVVFSKTLEEHTEHLDTILGLFDRIGMTIKGAKTFLGYPSIVLLGQRVNGFGMTTSEERVAAIRNLTFPKTLKDLETYLGCTGWLRQYIPYYAQLTEPLQNRKTRLLRKGPKAGAARKDYAKKTSIDDVSNLETESFKAIQRNFDRPTFLHHQDSKRRLYIDLDASKQYGFGVMIYHMKDDEGEPLDHTAKGNYQRVQPILFLSKILTDAETRYWPTELETASLVWTIKKVRHMIDGSLLDTVVWTDHSATVQIVKQTSLTTTATDKLNLRLIRASQYCSQFRLDVRHRDGKTNIVPDALSRLLNRIDESKDRPSKGDTLEDTDEIFTYHTTVIEMSEDFRQRIKEGYLEVRRWKELLKQLQLSEKETEETVSKGTNSFILENGLIYYIDPVDARHRLCVPKTLEKDIFAMAHDERAHAGFHRAYDTIVASLFMRHLSKRLKLYITHCPQCHHLQTVRHAPYGSLHPIVGPPIPFHTVTADFILALPKTSTGMDTLLTITDKFSKKVELIPGKETYTAADWAKAYFAATTDWAIPAVFIGDRDAKWLSKFWKQVFTDMGTKIASTTAYHPQSDGQSERTNQTVEVALRYCIARQPNAGFTDFCPALKRTFNNSRNTSTGRAPNEIIYGMLLNDSFGVVSKGNAHDFEQQRKVHQQEAQDAVAWANLYIKWRYDKSHTPLLLNPGDFVMLKLHDGYRVPGVKNKKLSIQRTGRFRIKRRVSPLAYELELPSNMKIHPIISVAHLEPLPPGKDPFDRPHDDHPPPVEESNPDDEWQSYAIERFLDRRIRRYGRGKQIVEYLVKWKGYGHECNEWYGEDILNSAVETMLDYELQKNNDPERIEMLRQKVKENEAAEIAAKEGAPVPMPEQPAKRKRGRPLGSKNKK
jgi:hypothetical protein